VKVHIEFSLVGSLSVFGLLFCIWLIRRYGYNTLLCRSMVLVSTGVFGVIDGRQYGSIRTYFIIVMGSAERCSLAVESCHRDEQCERNG
jgi:hypothetical protein